MNPHEPGDSGRRKFIYDLSLSSLSLLFVSALTGGCEDVISKINKRPVRRMIRNTSNSVHATDLYRTAVLKMKQLVAFDRRNWFKQAKIHDDFCPHNNWFFFPWHRAYLFEFEKICQLLTGDASFGLPYWNWCLNPRVPGPFFPPPNDNALIDNTREVGPSDQASQFSIGLNLVSAMCDEPDFFLFAGGATSDLKDRVRPGNIEATPHNYIHGTFVRGNMGQVPIAAQDPVFWCHHCMVDLCWHECNITRNHANTNDTTWLDFNFKNMFCDEQGNLIEDINVLATVLMPILSYRYETNIAGVTNIEKLATRNKKDFELMKKVIEHGAEMQFRPQPQASLKRAVELKVAARSLAETIPMNIDSLRGILQNTTNNRILLTIKEMSDPINSDVFIRVFLNKPDANPETPPTDPHYAGSFYFFTGGGGHHHGSGMPDYIVDVTQTLKRLQSSGEMANFKEGVMVNLVAVPVPGVQIQTQTLTIRDLELSVSPIEVKLMNIK